MHSIIPIDKKTDDRGWLAELIKKSYLKRKTFGQFFITTAKPGVTKGNHYHTRKQEFFIVIKGVALLTLEDLDKKSLKITKVKKIKLSGKSLKAIEILPW